MGLEEMMYGSQQIGQASLSSGRVDGVMIGSCRRNSNAAVVGDCQSGMVWKCGTMVKRTSAEVVVSAESPV